MTGGTGPGPDAATPMPTSSSVCGAPAMRTTGSSTDISPLGGDGGGVCGVPIGIDIGIAIAGRKTEGQTFTPSIFTPDAIALGSWSLILSENQDNDRGR